MVRLTYMYMLLEGGQWQRTDEMTILATMVCPVDDHLHNVSSSLQNPLIRPGLALTTFYIL